MIDHLGCNMIELVVLSGSNVVYGAGVFVSLTTEGHFWVWGGGLRLLGDAICDAIRMG